MDEPILQTKMAVSWEVFCLISLCTYTVHIYCSKEMSAFAAQKSNPQVAHPLPQPPYPFPPKLLHFFSLKKLFNDCANLRYSTFFGKKWKTRLISFKQTFLKFIRNIVSHSECMCMCMSILQKYWREIGFNNFYIAVQHK